MAVAKESIRRAKPAMRTKKAGKSEPGSYYQPAAEEDIFAENGERGGSAVAGGKHKNGGALFINLPKLINRTVIGTVLVVLLTIMGAGYFIFSRDQASQPAITPEIREQMVQPLEPAERPPPVAQSWQHQIEPADPSSNDTLVSNVVEVTGKKEKVQLLPPKQALIIARDLHFNTSSTEPLTIDWAAIWQRENITPFTSQTWVEITEEQMQGRLTKLAPTVHRYDPDPYFQGEERLTYRFHRDRVSSKPRQLTIDVTMGSPQPSLHIVPLSENYVVGERVTINAEGTLSYYPTLLRFEWEQLGGPQVMLESLESNGSVVSFITPSSFNTFDTPKITIRVSAVDPAGQRDSRMLEISTSSRRQNALWQGDDSLNLKRDSPLRDF